VYGRHFLEISPIFFSSWRRERVKSWSKPQHSSQLCIGYLTMPCTHLVHFSVSSLEGVVHEVVDSFGGGHSVFRSLTKGIRRANLVFMFYATMFPREEELIVFRSEPTRSLRISPARPFNKSRN
jgi:hypothetical protein